VEELVKKRFPLATRIHTDLMHRHHPKLTQAFIPAPLELEGKMDMLIELLDKINEKALASSASFPKTMIFANTASAAQRVYEHIHTHTAYPAVPFHKELKSVAEREENLRQFRENEVKILVCTDLASRGLDIPDVKQVVQVCLFIYIYIYIHTFRYKST
jgi:superfamily II DNA/RNA helicase